MLVTLTVENVYWDNEDSNWGGDILALKVVYATDIFFIKVIRIKM